MFEKKKLTMWRGLTTLFAVLFAFVLAASMVVTKFRTDLDKFLSTTSQAYVSQGEVSQDELYTYKSDYTSTTQLLDAIEDLGERMNEEGTVLLKNNNNALPLSSAETKKVSLLGFSSYNPVMGGDMGSSLSVNTGTAADTVDMVGAFKSKGFQLNSTLETLYNSDPIRETFKTVASSWGGTSIKYQIQAPSTTGVFSSKEPSQAAMNSYNSTWKDSMNANNVMIITIARSAGENKNYTPGTAGVDPTQSLNQTDPLGLSDDERDLINAAVASKSSNNGKVIVLLNNASALEIDEIKNNTGVDAILEIGLPGGYGFYGVADVLSGAANPSGHLADTYAVTNANSPAAQNYGNYSYTNADSVYSINSALVEAESIYDGYYYYETRYADCVNGEGNASSSKGASNGAATWSYNNEVSYPFGYGLSYTTFTQKLNNVSIDLAQRSVTATVTVKNTGSVAGKNVVQLYAQTPYTEYDKTNKVEKSAIQLLDYEKTVELKPGEEKTVTINADAQYLASWNSNETNIKGTKGTYILDAGEYYFSVGNGAHDALNNILAAQGKTTANGMTANGEASNAKSISLNFDKVTFARSNNGTILENQLGDMDLNTYLPGTVTTLTRSDWQGTFPKSYQNLTANAQMLALLQNDITEIKDDNSQEVTFGANNGLTLADLKGVTDINDIRWSDLMDQINLEDCLLRIGFGGTSTKPIASISSPEVIQNDGPNGINSYTLGQYANKDKTSLDPYAVDETDPNLNYKFGTMCNETVIAQTFSKEMAAEYGKVIGNYSIWSNLTIFWGAGTNLHRLPYNARNHEYYSEDPILSAYQGAAYIEAGNTYGVIIAPKHFAFNDTEVNRTGVSVFMSEQKARETELRGTQACIEDANALGVMTAFNRVGVTASNSHYGLMINILREEWGFQGLMSEDFIRDTIYSSPKEAAHCGITMTCNTGADTAALVAKWSFWTVENVSRDSSMSASVKQCMTWQYYAIANSNAMDGMSSNMKLINLRTWYDNVLTATQIVFGVLTVGAAAMFVLTAVKSKNEGGEQ